MNRDITYCANDYDCPFRFRCKRSFENHRNEIKEEQLLILSYFEHSNLKCDFYWEE